MKTWDEYKEHVKNSGQDGYKLMQEVEYLSDIISAVIAQRHELGLSQRELADLCHIPQSSVARIESFKTIPQLDTLLKIMQPLGLKLTVTKINEI